VSEASDRLLKAWRGEIEAGAVYELIAEREQDPKRAEILRRMAEAEAGHRRRIEQRLQELGIPVPDPATVRLSWWQRLQAKVAPVDRLLAAREAAEDDEVDDLYLRPTGDAQTDALLRDIRRDERLHSMAVTEMRTEAPAPARVAPSQTRLDRILGREKWHQAGSGWMSGAIYGANDGLAAVFGIVTGVSGATGGSHLVLTAGVAGAVASALSMATGKAGTKRPRTRSLPSRQRTPTGSCSCSPSKSSAAPRRPAIRCRRRSRPASPRAWARSSRCSRSSG
jgi:rubrerythrin